MNKPHFLRIYCIIVLATMIAVTTWASMESGVVEGFRYLFQNRWGIATLFDTYFAFIFFFLWLCTMTRSFTERAFWLFTILIFGNIAMAFYILFRFKDVSRALK